MGADHTQEECALTPFLARKLKGPAPEVREDRPGGQSGAPQSVKDPKIRRLSEQTR